jgi:hypothetical protein
VLTRKFTLDHILSIIGAVELDCGKEIAMQKIQLFDRAATRFEHPFCA